MTVENEDVESSSGSARAALGTLCLWGSAAILFLSVIDSSSSLSFMPRSWYSNRAVWSLGAVVAFFASIVLLRSKPSAQTRGAADSKAFKQVVLYTREGCHLCDEARTVLEKYAGDLPMIEEVDIDADPELRQKFDTCVPVVEIDGKVRFRGRVNEILLRRLMNSADPPADDIVERSA